MAALTGLIRSLHRPLLGIESPSKTDLAVRSSQDGSPPTPRSLGSARDRSLANHHPARRRLCSSRCADHHPAVRGNSARPWSRFRAGRDQVKRPLPFGVASRGGACVPVLPKRRRCLALSAEDWARSCGGAAEAAHSCTSEPAPARSEATPRCRPGPRQRSPEVHRGELPKQLAGRRLRGRGDFDTRGSAP